MNRRCPSLKKCADLYQYLIVVLVLNIPVVYSVLLINMKHVDFNYLTWFYLSSVAIGYYILPLLLISTFVLMMLFHFKKLAVIAVGLITTIYVYFLLIDSLAYNITKIHIDFFWLEWIINDSDAFGLSPTTFRTVLLVLLAIIAIQVGIFAIARRIKKPKWLVLTFILLVTLAFGVSQTIHAVAYERNVVTITSITPRLPAYYPITSHRNAAKFGGMLPKGEKLPPDVAEGKQGAFTYPIGKIEQCKPSDMTLPNIVVLFFESWRYDMLSEDVTPNAFALSQKSLVCSRHFSSVNSTVAGLFGFFYGLHATYWTAVKANNSAIHNPVLVDVLEENEYDFGIFARSNFKRHKVKDAVFRGIEVRKSFAGDSKVEQDLDMTRQLIGFLREQQDSTRPFFAFGFYKSNHAPYWYREIDTLFRPAGDQNLMLANDETDPTFYLNDYKNSTHYVDELIGQILRELDSLGYMSNTIIIVTTDHGEQFNDNRSNYWGHGTNFTQYQTLVPLILFAPGKEPQTITHATSHVDIVPTILEEFLGCTNDVRDYSNGRNLFGEDEEPRPFVVGGYVNHAYIIEDNVYEIYPFYTKDYRLDNIREKASAPSRRMLTMIVDEITRFYADTDPSNQGEPTIVVDDEKGRH